VQDPDGGQEFILGATAGEQHRLEHVGDTGDDLEVSGRRARLLAESTLSVLATAVRRSDIKWGQTDGLEAALGPPLHWEHDGMTFAAYCVVAQQGLTLTRYRRYPIYGIK
jgi:hypothetical protein